MKKVNLFVSLSLAVVMAACTDKPLEVPVVPEEETIEAVNPIYELGIMDVQFSEDMLAVIESADTKSGIVQTKSAELNEGFASLGIKSIRRIFPDAGEFEPRHRKYGLHKWYRVEFDEEIPQTKASGSLADIPGIEKAQPVPVKKVNATDGRHYFNDPYAYYQWNYFNDGKKPTTGKTDKAFKAGVDINVVPVWEKYTAGTPNVIVAVIDEGVDPNHEDLAPVLDPNSRNFLDTRDDLPLFPGDHGCHTSGTIGAINNNRLGVAGVAGGKDGNGGVSIMSCCVSDGEHINGNTEEAFVWAADHGAVIASNSWGLTVKTKAAADEYYELFRRGQFEAALKDAIDYFIDNAGYDINGNQTGPMAGGVVFWSSGNENIEGGVYCRYEKVLAVGALAPNGTRASYSNYGDWVDLAAPGGDDLTGSGEDLILSCVATGNGTPYAFMAGTSMACPHASGVAALLVSYFGGPGFTAEELKERMLYGAKPASMYDFDHPLGRGLDALGAFEYKYGHLDPLEFVTEYEGDFKFKSHENTTITFNVLNNDNEIYPVGAESNTEAVTFEIKGNVINMKVNALAVEPGTYKAKIYGGVGTSVEAIEEFDIVILENHAPVKASAIDGQAVGVKKGSTTIDLNKFFIDPDGESLTYTATSSQESIVTASTSGSSLVMRSENYGDASITVVATDARGLSVKQSFAVVTRDTSRPVDIYPNPVTDYLYVRPGEAANVDVALYSANGAKAVSFSGEVGLFSPAKLDVKSIAAGTYTAVVKFGEEEIRQTVVKY